MVRRVVAQFGFAAVTLALVGGAAFADNAASSDPANAPANPQQPSQPTVTVQTDSGSVQIQTSTTTQQTIGGSSASNQSGTGSGTGDGTTPGSSSPTTAAPSPNSTDPSTYSSLAPAASHTPAASASQGQGGSGAVGQTQSVSSNQITTGALPNSGDGGAPGGLATESWHQVVVQLGAQLHPPMLQAAPAASAPTSPLPGAPHAPTNFFLGQLPWLLQQVVVPMAHKAPVMPIPARLPQALVLLSCVFAGFILAGKLVHLPSNSYTAGLRRSGFLGAARSDVGPAISTFATPREMGCIFAPAT